MTTDVAIPATELDFEHLSPLICMELAAGLSTPAGVRQKYEITDDQWLRLQNNPTFLHMMKEATLAFAGDMNAGKRITKKAEILLEESLPILHKLMTAPEASTATVIDVVKQLTVLAEKGPKNKQEGGGVGAGFNVQIEVHTSGKQGVVIQGN